MARLPKIEEPKFDGAMTTLNMINALNWYHQSQESKDAQRYIQEYAKQNKIAGRVDTSQSFLTLGWLCRLATNGNDIGEKGRKYITEGLARVLQKDVVTVTESVAEPTVTFSIQERLRDKIAEIAGDLEGAVDDYIEGGYKSEKSPFTIMQGRAKGMHANKLIEIFKKRRIEFDNVLHTTDSQVKEGYSNFTKPQLKKVIAYYDQIITDAMKVSGEAKVGRKPRARKKKTADQLVAKLQFLVESPEYKIASIKPKEVIGAMQLWVFNVKTRKLGVYHAEDAGGIQVKGSSLLNYSESKSIHKGVRKPLDVLPKVLSAGKIALRSVLSTIASKESQLSGRINKDTILLRVM